MISSLLAQGVGLSVWIASLGLGWYLVGRRRKLPSALWIPGFVATLPLAFILRGLLGDVSLALPALTWYAAGSMRLSRPARSLLASMLAVAAALYASALGFLEYDLYALGYRPAFGLIAVGAAVLAAYRWMPVLGWSWLLGLGLFAASLHPSPNLWDSLLDLPATVLAVLVVIRARSSRPKSDGVAAGCS
jgi:hypothetical protein